MGIDLYRNFFQWQSLKTRVTLLTLAIFLLSLWSLSFYVSRMLRQDLEQMLGEQQFSTVAYMAADVNDGLTERLEALNRVAETMAPVLHANSAALQAHLESKPLLQLLFNAGTLVVGADGVGVASIPLALGRNGTSYMDRDLVIAALKEGKAMIGKPVIGRKLNFPIFSMAVPMRDRQGQVIGALIGVINLGQPSFMDRITQHHYGQNGGYVLVAPQHRLIVTGSDARNVMRAMPAPGLIPQVDRFASGFEGTVIYRNGLGVEVLNSVKRVPAAGWYLAANLPTAEAFAPIRAMQRRILVSSLFLTLLAGLLTWALLRRQLAPLFATVKTLANLSGQDQTPQALPITSQDEVGELIGSFNQLLATLRVREVALQASEHRFRHFFEMNASVMVLSDPATGTIVETNDAAAAYYGYARADMAGMDINHIIALSPEILAEKRTQAMSGQSQHFQFAVRLASGEMRDVESHVTPFEADGRRLLFSIIHDITERKREQAALRLARISVDATSDALFWVTPDARIVDANMAGCRLLGYTKEKLLQLHVSDINPSPHVSADQWPQYFAELRQLGSRQYQASILTRDGRQVPVDVATSYVQDGNTEYSCALVRDITQRKRIEAELLAAKLDAEKANNAKSHFLAAASHDLRQPLFGLTLYIGVLKSQAAPELAELINGIEDCCEGLSELLTDLLDISKLDAGIVTPMLSGFAVDELLESIMTVHAPQAQSKGLGLRWRRGGPLVYTDQTLLRRIVRNLVDNAISYTHRGGVLIACRRHAGKHWIEVWDTGVGIPADKSAYIFEDFKQLSDDSNRRGSGLGLAIVARAAALLGLQICQRSRVGRGSLFAIELPPGLAALPTQAPADRVDTRALRIGLVEDNAQVLRALVVALQAVGHSVVSAMTAPELLERLGQQAPDIVISDYRLGAGQTGFEAIEAARTVFGASLAAIIITGDTDPAVLRGMAERGIAVHFKPLQMDTLQTIIKDATERSST